MADASPSPPRVEQPESSGYRRADLGESAEIEARDAPAVSIRWLILPLAVFLSAAQSVLFIWASNVRLATLSGSLIPVLGFAALFATVMLLNPALRWLASVLSRRAARWVPRPFGRAELATLYAAMLVTSGIAVFGLVEQLVPLVAAPFDARWNTLQRDWSGSLVNLNRHLYITDPEIIALYREGIAGAPPDSASWGEHFAFGARVVRTIPWSAWLTPLSFWMILVAAMYGLFYSLAYVVLPHWSRREKLIFPLAQLPQHLLPDERMVGSPPPIARRFGFWAAFVPVFLLLAWNGVVASGWVSGVGPVTMGMGSWRVNEILEGTALEGISHSIALLLLITATGLAFLVPMEMSFSAWFYYLFGRGVLLMAVWMGYGQTAGDFRSDFLWNTNPSSAQGGGGLFMFSIISLVRCVMDYRRLAKGKPLSRQAAIAMPVVGMAVCCAVLVGWFTWNGLSVLWAMLFVLVLTLLTVGLMRIVAESGIYWIQTHAGFFHFYKMLGLGRWLAPSVIAPFLPIYSVLFLDLKSFLAPNLLNAAKLRQDERVDRWRFHTIIISSLVASVVVSIFFAIFLAYSRGANLNHYWFYRQAPQLILDTARDTVHNPPMNLNPVTTSWFGFGAVWVALSLFLRQRLFWFPHPIGYIMLINPLMDQLWLSFFIAWMIKKLVVRYGGKATYDRARDAAVGMITGELVAIAVWIAISLICNIAMPYITIDRYGP